MSDNFLNLKAMSRLWFDALFDLGIRPGTLLIAKETAKLNIYYGPVEQLREGVENLDAYQAMEILSHPIPTGKTIMFIGIQSFQRKIEDFSWEFWGIFLLEEKVGFVPLTRLGRRKLLNEFEIKNC